MATATCCGSTGWCATCSPSRTWASPATWATSSSWCAPTARPGPSAGTAWTTRTASTWRWSAWPTSDAGAGLGRGAAPGAPPAGRPHGPMRCPNAALHPSATARPREAARHSRICSAARAGAASRVAELQSGTAGWLCGRRGVRVLGAAPGPHGCSVAAPRVAAACCGVPW